MFRSLATLEFGFHDAVFSGVFKTLLLSGIIYLFIRNFPTDGVLNIVNIHNLIHGRNSIRRETERLQNAIAVFARFKHIADSEVQRMQKSYAKIGRYHKRVGYDIGYPSKLRRLSKANESNSIVTERIAKLAMSQHKLDTTFTHVNSNDLAKVREVFKHYVRDWSLDGAKERGVIFGPILTALREIVQESGLSSRSELDVLVPGSGLGRLAWEIHEMGAFLVIHEPCIGFIVSPKVFVRRPWSSRRI